MKKFCTGTNGVVSDATLVRTDNLNWMQDSKEQAIKERLTDCFTAGILQQQSGVPFAMTDNGDGTISIGTGVGYSTLGERILVATADTTTAYSASNPTATSSDGIGGTVVTPYSSGCSHVPITNDSIPYYIGIKYLFTCDNSLGTTNYSVHPITLKRMYYKWTDGYDIEIATNPALLTGLYIGSATRTGTLITIDMSGKSYFSIYGGVNSLTTPNITDGAVTVNKIASGAVERVKLAAELFTGIGYALIPPGFIGMWSGLVANIPTGWFFCNGSHGTPDLRDRFILSVNEGDPVMGPTALHTVSIGVNNLPAHDHHPSTTAGFTGIQSDHHYHFATTGTESSDHAHEYATHSNVLTADDVGVNTGSGGAWRYQTTIQSSGTKNISTGAAQTHTHSVSTTIERNSLNTLDQNHTHAIASVGIGLGLNIDPPYFKLAFIMKS